MTSSKKFFVFVELGRKIPKYAIANMLRMQNQFDSVDVIVIVDSDSSEKLLKRHGVPSYRYSRTKAVNHLLIQLAHEKTFRNGFWELTIDRLFSLCDFVLNVNNVSVIHIESDVLVLPNFPVKSLFEMQNMAWMRYNSLRDVASVLYIPDRKEAYYLHQKMLSVFSENPDLTDMTALRLIQVSSCGRVLILPSLAIGFENTNSTSNLDLRECSRELNEDEHGIEGIFDGAVIGMFVTGQDPRNNFGITKYLDAKLLDHSESFLDLTDTKFTLSEGRFFMEKANSHKKIEVFNLHIHSKNKKLFMRNYQNTLSRMARKASLQKPYKRFKVSAFVFLLKEKIKRVSKKKGEFWNWQLKDSKG
jgi:hypothetical protein